jgi:di/tricarboxylate transporter
VRSDKGSEDPARAPLRAAAWGVATFSRGGGDGGLCCALEVLGALALDAVVMAEIDSELALALALALALVLAMGAEGAEEGSFGRGGMGAEPWVAAVVMTAVSAITSHHGTPRSMSVLAPGEVQVALVFRFSFLPVFFSPGQA